MHEYLAAWYPVSLQVAVDFIMGFSSPQINVLPLSSTTRAHILVPLVSAIIWIVLKVCKRRAPQNVSFLPMPDSDHLVWGHEKAVYMNPPGYAYRKWIQQCGHTFRIKAALTAPDNLVLADPTAITYLLRKQIYNYHHSAVVRPRIARFMGKGLGWVEGEKEHRLMRRLTLPSLTADNINKMSSIIAEVATMLCDGLSQLTNKDDINEKVEIDLLGWMGKAVLNIVGRVAFRYDFDGVGKHNGERILTSRRRSIEYSSSYTSFFALMLLRRFTFLNYIPIPVIQGQALARNAIVDGVAKSLEFRNNDPLESVQADSEPPKDLLTLLTDAVKEGKLYESDLNEHIPTFIMAGFETTSTSIAFAIWELARNPDKQERLRREISELGGRISIKDDKGETPYLEAVLKETLRLYPALAYMERVATKVDTIPLAHPVKLSNGDLTKEVIVQPGQTVIIPIIAIQRQETIWKDPDIFRPERWLRPKDLPSAGQLNTGWEGLLSFSDGPRSCIGIHLAILNFKTILASLITRFRFEDNGLRMELKISSSIQPWVYRPGENTGRNELPVTLQTL